MRRIVYVMNHQNHLPYLVVSLRSLRDHWHGPVTVHAWSAADGHQGAYDIAKRIGEDSNLDIVVKERVPIRRGRNDQFEDKQLVMQKGIAGFDELLYLDADTIIRGSLDPLFDEAEKSGFVCTQFCEWVSTGGIISGRVKKLRDYPEINQKHVESLLTTKWPSVNGGIFACRPDSPVLPLWHEWTKIARKIFIADETVLHTMMLEFGPKGQLGVATGGKWNCSPIKKYRPKGLADEDVIVWHFHGDSATRFEKSPEGVAMWWAEYQGCLRDNVGGIAEWRPKIHYKHLDQCERDVSERMCG